MGGSAHIWDRAKDDVRMKEGLLFVDESLKNKYSVEPNPVDLSPSYVLAGLRLWDRKTGRLLFRPPSYPRERVKSVFLNESESHIICLTTSGIVRRFLFFFGSCSETRILEKDERFQLNTRGINCMSLDGDFLFTGDCQGDWQLWDFSDGMSKQHHPIKLAKGHDRRIFCCCMKYPIAITGSAEAKIWNIEGETLLRTLVFSLGVAQVAMNYSSFFTVEDDEEINLCVWDRKKCLDKSFQSERTSDFLMCSLQSILVDCPIVCRPTGFFYADSAACVVEKSLWKSIRNFNALRNFYVENGISSMDCDDEVFICKTVINEVLVFDRQTFTQILDLGCHAGTVTSLDLDRNFFITSTRRGTKVWKRSDGGLFQTFKGKLVYCAKIVRGKIYISDKYGTEVFSQPNLSSQFEIEHRVGGLKYMGSLAPDGEYLCASVSCEDIKVWKYTEDGKPIQEYIVGHNFHPIIMGQIFMSNPYLLLCNKNVLHIFHSENGRLLKSLVQESRVRFVTVYNGIIIVGCDSGAIALWDLKTVLESGAELDTDHPACIQTLRDHTREIVFLCVNMDELVSADYEGHILLRKINQTRLCQ